MGDPVPFERLFPPPDPRLGRDMLQSFRLADDQPIYDIEDRRHLQGRLHMLSTILKLTDRSDEVLRRLRDGLAEERSIKESIADPSWRDPFRARRGTEECRCAKIQP